MDNLYLPGLVRGVLCEEIKLLFAANYFEIKRGCRIIPIFNSFTEKQEWSTEIHASFSILIPVDYSYFFMKELLRTDRPLIIFIVVAVICSVVLNKTSAGRYILSLGSNKEAVRLSGVNVKKWEMLAYIICGLLVGIAAIFYVGAYTTVQPGYGDQYNNEAIAGCVMGGTSMAGGLASIGGTVIGVFIISLLQEGILALGFTKDWQLIITGVIVIVAVYADVVSRRKKN